MNDVKVLISDEDIDQALLDAASLPVEPTALSGEYRVDLDLIVLRLDTGRRLIIPREEVQELQNATPAQLVQIDIYAGVDIDFPQAGVNLYLPYLLEGRFGSEAWMRSLDRRPVAA